jgi:hypothetical protein
MKRLRKILVVTSAVLFFVIGSLWLRSYAAYDRWEWRDLVIEDGRATEDLFKFQMWNGTFLFTVRQMETTDVETILTTLRRDPSSGFRRIQGPYTKPLFKRFFQSEGWFVTRWKNPFDPAGWQGTSTGLAVPGWMPLVALAFGPVVAFLKYARAMRKERDGAGKDQPQP